MDSNIVSFRLYEMEYRGGPIAADLALVPFQARYYEQYKNVVNGSYHTMRKALGIQPYGHHCDTLENLLERKEDVLLHFDGDALIGTVTCHGNEIGTLAVNPEYQRQGHGRRIMTAAIALMQRRGVTPIKLSVTKWNERAFALYKSLGFVVTKEGCIQARNARDADGSWSFEVTAAGSLTIR